MRTTIRLQDDLLRQVKRRAVETGKTLTAFIEDALRTTLYKSSKKTPPSRIRLATFGGSGLQPGVDLDDSASLIDQMEKADDTP